MDAYMAQGKGLLPESLGSLAKILTFSGSKKSYLVYVKKGKDSKI